MTATARTPTVGAVGRWSISGLTTPDSYLVTAMVPGYGASTTLTTLGPGGSSGAVDLSLKPGTASIEGVVTVSGSALGDVTVTATDGTVTKSVTTLTGAGGFDSGVVGKYVIPDLPMPGTWTLTASAAGCISQSQWVSLAGPAVSDSGKAVANFELSATSASVSGVVTDPGRGLGGVGVVMTNGVDTYKTLTATSSGPGSGGPAGSGREHTRCPTSCRATTFSCSRCSVTR